MKSVAGENISLLTVRKPDANDHVILAIANPHHRKDITLRGCSYLRIAVVEPGRLSCPVNAERLFDDKAVLPIAKCVKSLRAENEQSHQAQHKSCRHCCSHEV